MGKSKIEVSSLPDGGYLMKRAKGHITFQEVYEQLDKLYEYGPHFIFIRVPYGEAPEELYDDGDELEVYSAEQVANSVAVVKAYDTGFEDGRKFALEEIQANDN